MKYIIANWKAHKTRAEASAWVDSITEKISRSPEVAQKLDQDQLRILVACPFPYLSDLSQKITRKNLQVTSQDVSVFDEGPHTGETTAKMLEGLVVYVLVGHSERRDNFHETDEVVLKKAELAVKYNLTPIVCIQDESNVVPPDSIIAYDPKEAIGTGKNILSEDISSLKKKLSLPQGTVFLYGGSVNEQNIGDYLLSQEIDGFLVGGASLDPDEFFTLIKKL